MHCFTRHNTSARHTSQHACAFGSHKIRAKPAFRAARPISPCPAKKLQKQKTAQKGGVGGSTSSQSRSGYSLEILVNRALFSQRIIYFKICHLPRRCADSCERRSRALSMDTPECLIWQGTSVIPRRADVLRNSRRNWSRAAERSSPVCAADVAVGGLEVWRALPPKRPPSPSEKGCTSFLVALLFVFISCDQVPPGVCSSCKFLPAIAARIVTPSVTCVGLGGYQMARSGIPGFSAPSGLMTVQDGSGRSQSTFALDVSGFSLVHICR